MRWDDENENDRRSAFRSDVTLPSDVGFAALRLRAKLAGKGNNTNVPSDDDDTRGDSDSTPVS